MKDFSNDSKSMSLDDFDNLYNQAKSKFKCKLKIKFEAMKVK